MKITAYILLSVLSSFAISADHQSGAPEDSRSQYEKLLGMKGVSLGLAILSEPDSLNYNWDFPVPSRSLIKQSMVLVNWVIQKSGEDNPAIRNALACLTLFQRNQLLSPTQSPIWPYCMSEIISFFNTYMSEFRNKTANDNEKYLTRGLESEMQNLHRLNLYWLQQKSYNGDLKKGFTGRFDTSGQHVFFYVQGGWNVSNENLLVMPRFLMGIFSTNLLGKVYIPCDYDFSTPLGSGMVVSSTVTEDSPFLVIKVGATSADLIFLNGRRSDVPFGITQKTTLSKESPGSNEIYETLMSLPNSSGKPYFSPGQTYCFAIPETNTDLDVLELLLAQIENIEKGIDALRPSIVEEVESDEDTAKASSNKSSQEAKKLMREEAKKAEKERKAAETKQRMRDLQEAAIRALEEEIEKKEALETEVRLQQQAISERVASDATKVSTSPQKKKGPSQDKMQTKQKAEDPPEDPVTKRLRIRALAEAEFQAKKVSLKEVASVLNRIFKIIPSAREVLLPSTRQRGSHLVMGGSAQSAPTTLVVPHHGGDGTVYAQNAHNFVKAFVGFLTGSRQTDRR